LSQDLVCCHAVSTRDCDDANPSVNRFTVLAMYSEYRYECTRQSTLERLEMKLGYLGVVYAFRTVHGLFITFGIFSSSRAMVRSLWSMVGLILQYYTIGTVLQYCTTVVQTQYLHGTLSRN
jgi:hypothetical protein